MFEDFCRAVDCAEKNLYQGILPEKIRLEARERQILNARTLAKEYPEFVDWYAQKFPRQKYRLEILK